jgi:hypothetical protein
LRGRTLELAVLGPWRRAVDLDSLESIRWKHTGGAASRGTMFVRDRSGRRVPIYVGRFSGGRSGASCCWTRLRAPATVDDTSKRFLVEAASTAAA